MTKISSNLISIFNSKSDEHLFVDFFPKRLPSTYLVLTSLLFCSLVNAQTIILDGEMDDWAQPQFSVADPKGDSKDAFDVTKVLAATNKRFCYLSIELTKELNLQSGDKNDGNLQLVLKNSNKTLTIDFRNRVAEYTAVGQARSTVSWNKLGFTSLPTFASKQHEMRIDLSLLGFDKGENINVMITGSDDVEKFNIKSNGNPAPKKKLDLSKQAGSFRIANLNTLRQGIGDPQRSKSIKELLELSKADIFTFQEEWDRDLFEKNVSKVFPSKNGSKVNTLWGNGCAIASNHRVFPVQIDLERGVAGNVIFERNGYWLGVLVIAAHFKCCGYAGSKEDEKRINTVRHLTKAIENLPRLYKGMPIVIVGDYNLVGSRTPLTILEGAGFKQLKCLNTDYTATTWRGLKPNESFWPGRLDLIVSKGLAVEKGQIFDSSKLDGFGKPNLSQASDHLMLLGDFNLSQKQ